MKYQIFRQYSDNREPEALGHVEADDPIAAMQEAQAAHGSGGYGAAIVISRDDVPAPDPVGRDWTANSGVYLGRFHTLRRMAKAGIATPEDLRDLQELDRLRRRYGARKSVELGWV